MYSKSRYINVGATKTEESPLDLADNDAFSVKELPKLGTSVPDSTPTPWIKSVSYPSEITYAEQAFQLIEREGHVQELSQPEPSSQTSGNLLAFFEPWVWEIAGAVVGLLCITAMAAILASVDGKPVESCTATSISPNFLISVFSTIGKSAFLLPISECLSQLKWILFKNNMSGLYYLEICDRASRGTLGSLQLLRHFKFKRWLSALGAILMILAFAVDPFTQLVLSVDTRSAISGNDTATVPVSNIYTHPYNVPGRFF